MPGLIGKSTIKIFTQSVSHSYKGWYVTKIDWEPGFEKLCEQFDKWREKENPQILDISINKRDGGDPIEYWIEMIVLYQKEILCQS